MRSIFKKRKAALPPQVQEATQTAEESSEVIKSMAAERAPHNPHQKLITAAEQGELPASELMAQAVQAGLPAMMTAMTTIARRFEQFVVNIDAVNRGLAEFKREVSEPLRDELKHLRYNLGDKVTLTTTNLDSMVSALDRQVWALLRASGMSDDKIREYRTEHGMNPDAPSSQELELQANMIKGLQDTIDELKQQNERLLSQLNGK